VALVDRQVDAIDSRRRVVTVRVRPSGLPAAPDPSSATDVVRLVNVAGSGVDATPGCGVAVKRTV
jgi:hypothetical protein